MADLGSLIRLHKHDLDEKRRALGELYAAQAELERVRREMERTLEHEKEAASNSDAIHFTFASYVEQAKKQIQGMDARIKALEQQIDAAKDDMMNTFSELKKYEMAQAERDRKDADAARIKEAKTMDEIGLQGFIRQTEEEQTS